jgi:hypothetical protein
MSADPSKAGVPKNGQFNSLKKEYKFHVVKSFDKQTKVLTLCSDEINSLEDYNTHIEYNQETGKYPYDACKELVLSNEDVNGIIGFSDLGYTGNLKFWNVSNFTLGTSDWKEKLYGIKLNTKGGRSNRATFRQRKLKSQRHRRRQYRTRRTRR